MLELDARWDNYFLSLCAAAASHSKEPDTRVGAVIVGPSREIISIGHNGFPRGMFDKEKQWKKDEFRLPYVLHAEVNAILEAGRMGKSCVGGRMYLLAMTADGFRFWGGEPCLNCAIHIAQAGIIETRSPHFKTGPSKWKELTLKGEALLQECGVETTRLCVETINGINHDWYKTLEPSDDDVPF